MAIARPASAPIAGGARPHVEYDDATDTLFFRLSNAPGVASHIKEELWVLRDPQTHEVVGIFIEDFERVFIARHPELAVAWKKGRPPLVHRWSAAMWENFTRVFLGWLKRNNKELSQSLCPV